MNIASRSTSPLRRTLGIGAWMRLARWPNLGIILLTQAAVWWCVVQPLGSRIEVLQPAGFVMLAFSTVAIAAAGYIINDYFDIRIDAINRPDRTILAQKVHRRTAIILHSLLNALGLGLAFAVARAANAYWLVLLQLGCTVLLWFYSTHLKQRFALGNIAVALLTALTVIALGIYEPAIIDYAGRPAMFSDGRLGIAVFNPAYILAGYAYFAFVLTWMREVVKDMEDLPGDSAEGCETMPIRWGLLRSSRFVQGLAIASVLPLLYGSIRAMRGGVFVGLGLYLLLLIVAPLILWAVHLPRKASTRHYAAASRQLKILMIVGIGFLFLYRYA